MATLQTAVDFYWNGLLGGAIHFVETLFNGEFDHPWVVPAIKSAVTLLFLWYSIKTISRLYFRILERMLEKNIEGHSVREPYTVRDTSFVEELDAAQFPVHTLTALIKEKAWGKLGDIHARLNQPAESAKWYLKDKQYLRAAEQLARAGRTLQAARLLQRCGEYETAAHFWLELGNYGKAAKAYKQAGNLPEAARAWITQGKVQQGIRCFEEILNSRTIGAEEKVKAADLCYHLIQNSGLSSRLPIAQKNELYKALARTFLSAKRPALAASLFQEAGETGVASEIFKRLNAPDVPTYKKEKP